MVVKKKLLDIVRDKIRIKHYNLSIKWEQSVIRVRFLVFWIYKKQGKSPIKKD